MSRSKAGACTLLVVPLLCAAFGARAQEDLPVPGEALYQDRGCVGAERESLFVKSPFQPPAAPALQWHDMVTNVPGDWARAGSGVVVPEHLPVIVGVAALTGGLIMVDHETYVASKSLYDRSPVMKSVSESFVHVGDGSTHLGIAAAFGLFGLIAHDDRALRTGSQTVEALLASGITVQLLKRIAGRESPEKASGSRGVWRPFPNLKSYEHDQAKYYSFPSGHITTTMATLTVIAENYPEEKWIRPVGYVLLAGVGIGLVNVRYHWYSDLPLGLLLGYAFGKIAAHRYDVEPSPEANEQHARILISPAVSRDGAGVALAVVF